MMLTAKHHHHPHHHHHHQQQQCRLLSPLIIKVTNFLQYSAAVCIVPYLSVYFLHYTAGTSSHVGVINLVASILGIALSLSLGSIGDRYRAHRSVYLVSLSMIFISVVLLFEPIIGEFTGSGGAGHSTTRCEDFTTDQHQTNSSSLAANYTNSSTGTPSGVVVDNNGTGYHLRHRGAKDPALERTLSSGKGRMQHLPATELLNQPDSDLAACKHQAVTTIDQVGGGLSLVASESPSVVSATLRFYLVCVCYAIAEMAATTIINLSDSFSTDIARRCNTSYGSVRLWGAAGQIFASTVLALSSKLSYLSFELAPLTENLCLFTLFMGSNVILVACWPDGRPFDLASSSSSDGGGSYDAHGGELQTPRPDEDQLTPPTKSMGLDWDTNQSKVLKFAKKAFHLPNLSLANGLRFVMKNRRRNNVQLQHIGNQQMRAMKVGEPIQLKARWTFAFDLQIDDYGRNVRRCSLVPLGNSHLIRQFELDVRRASSYSELPTYQLKSALNQSISKDNDGNINQQQHIAAVQRRHSKSGASGNSRKASSSSLNVQLSNGFRARTQQSTKKHFNYITVIEPKKSVVTSSEQQDDNRLANGCGYSIMDSLPSNNTNHDHSNQVQLVTATFFDDNYTQQRNDAHDESTDNCATTTTAVTTAAAAAKVEPMSLRLHLKIIQLIARHDKNMIRFMLLFVVYGFTAAMNWIYLFPYLKSLNEEKFESLAAYIIMSSYSAEIIFYKISPRITQSLSHSQSLSFILLVLAFRYSLYLVFAIWPQAWPLEAIILIELLQSLSMGLFNCVFVGIAMDLASKARYCVPKLVTLGYISGDNPELVEQVNSGVKLTFLSVSSCCLDGVGVALGSLVGGWLIDNYGYRTLWSSSIALALSCGLINCLLDLGGYAAAGPATAPSGSAQDAEDEEARRDKINYQPGKESTRSFA